VGISISLHQSAEARWARTTPKGRMTIMPMPPKMAWATMTFCDEVQSPADVDAPLPVTALVGVAVGSMPVPAESQREVVSRLRLSERTSRDQTHCWWDGRYG
jgi:hypothetical protein